MIDVFRSVRVLRQPEAPVSIEEGPGDSADGRALLLWEIPRMLFVQVEHKYIANSSAQYFLDFLKLLL